MTLHGDDFVLTTAPSTFGNQRVYLRLQEKGWLGGVATTHLPPDDARKVALAILDALRGIHE